MVEEINMVASQEVERFVKDCTPKRCELKEIKIERTSWSDSTDRLTRGMEYEAVADDRGGIDVTYFCDFLSNQFKGRIVIEVDLVFGHYDQPTMRMSSEQKKAFFQRVWLAHGAPLADKCMDGLLLMFGSITNNLKGFLEAMNEKVKGSGLCDDCGACGHGEGDKEKVEA